MRYTLQIELQKLNYYALVLSSLIVIAGLLSSQATAATTPEQTASADIRDSGFVYCVSGQVNTFNPQKASSGLIVDTGRPVI